MYTERPQGRDIGNTILWVFVSAIILVAVITTSFALNWISVPFNVMSPQNVQNLSKEANDTWEGLQAQKASINVQEARLAEFYTLYGEDEGKWAQGKRQEYGQISQGVRNLTTAYNLSCGQYNALWKDEWRDVPAPNDLPRHCDLID